MEKRGWSVQIQRKDGTNFLCANDIGNFPPIWTKKNRKWAVLHKKELKIHGFKAKVVPVLYSEPALIK